MHGYILALRQSPLREFYNLVLWTIWPGRFLATHPMTLFGQIPAGRSNMWKSKTLELTLTPLSAPMGSNMIYCREPTISSLDLWHLFIFLLLAGIEIIYFLKSILLFHYLVSWVFSIFRLRDHFVVRLIDPWVAYLMIEYSWFHLTCRGFGSKAWWNSRLLRHSNFFALDIYK
jgi:hypothetical protein